ncbi:MAG: DUF3828 domain-containing protein [Devosia sp.]
MRTIGLVLTALLMLIGPAALAAPVFEDPKGLIAYAYTPYGTGQFPEDLFELYSPTLTELWEAMEARTPEGEVGAIDFDPFINAQDYEIKDLAIGDAAIDGDQAIVMATFTNFGEPREMRFTLVRRAEGWKIDDIEALSGEYPWRLSELLAADPLLN